MDIAFPFGIESLRIISTHSPREKCVWLNAIDYNCYRLVGGNDHSTIILLTSQSFTALKVVSWNRSGRGLDPITCIHCCVRKFSIGA